MKYFCIILFLLLSLVDTSAQNSSSSSFRLETSFDTVGLEETLVLNYIVENTQVIDFPRIQFQNFTLISGPNISQSFSSINGKISRTSTYSYYVRPVNLGEFSLPIVEIETTDGFLLINEKQIVVLEQSNNPIQENQSFSNSPFNQNFHIEHFGQSNKMMEEMMKDMEDMFPSYPANPRKKKKDQQDKNSKIKEKIYRM